MTDANWEDGPRYAPIPDDGRSHEIESRPMMLEWGRAPLVPSRPYVSRVMVVPDRPCTPDVWRGQGREAVDCDGRMYHRHDCGWGWLWAGHVDDVFPADWPDPNERGKYAVGDEWRARILVVVAALRAEQAGGG